MNALSRFVTLAVLSALLFSAPAAHAILYWRVSVKVFQDSNGTPPRPDNEPNYNTLQEIRNAFDLINNNFDRMGWGVRLQLRDLITVNNNEWFNKAARDGDNRNQLEILAKVQLLGQFQYRGDSINIYINNSGSGVSGGHLPLIGDVILLGIKDVVGTGTNTLADRFWVKTLLHETGHAMGLCHTQGCGCNGCSPDPLGSCDTPGDDGYGDTLRDVACWTTNDIALNNFGKVYTALNSAQARQVDLTWSNLMSYHAQSIGVLSHDQWERMIDVANFEKRNVTTGKTIFVDRGNSCLRPEDLADPFDDMARLIPGWSWGTRNSLSVRLDPRNPPEGACGPLPPGVSCSLCPPIGPCPPAIDVCLGGPFKNVADAINSANSNDRLQIRAGNYNQTMRITKPITLATDRGVVAIGRP